MSRQPSAVGSQPPTSGRLSVRKVAINGCCLNLPNTGTGQYTVNLIRELRALLGEGLVVLPSSPSPTAVGEGDEGGEAHSAGAGGEARPLGGRDRDPRSLAPGPRPLTPRHWAGLGPLHKLWLEQVEMPRAAGRTGARLLHVPYFGSPLFAPCPVVVTVHDLIMLVLPQHRGSALVQLYTRLVAAAARRARLVVADSECTKRDLVRLLAMPEERIRVVYLGVGEAYRPVSDQEQLAAIRARYGLGERFVFYVGGLDWRKNVVTLITAAAALPGGCELAIAGKAHSSNPTLFPDLPAAARATGAAGRVRFLGAVPAADLPALYSAAALFVFPSRYEGFGLTPLEAMACGAPVISSNSSSLPEVVGDGGLLFDPEDASALAKLMRAVLEDRGLARDLRGRGLAQASKFNWRRTAEETVAVYREAGCAQG